MKKILLSLLLAMLLLPLHFSASQAQVNYAVMFLTSQNRQVLSGNVVDLELVVNSMGNHIQTASLDVIIEGPMDPMNLSYNLHPLHNQRLHTSSGLSLDGYNITQLSDNAVLANLQFVAKNSQGFNEGSGAIPLFLIKINTLEGGTINAHIDNLSMTYQEDNVRTDNYNPSARPFQIEVLNTQAPNAPITYLPSPTPAAMQTPQPNSPTPVASPVNYDQEFEQLTQELALLNQRVEQQEQEVGILKQMITRILEFFQRFL